MNSITTLAIVLGSLATIVTSLTLLWVKVVRPFIAFTKRLGEVVEVIQTLPEWQDSVDQCLNELRPNGGGSIKDRVARIESLIDDHVHDPVCHAVRNRPVKK